MKKFIRIKALTKVGEKAIKIHLEEYKRIGFKEKIAFKTLGYSQELIKPDVLMVTINNPQCAKPEFMSLLVGQVWDSLKENKAGEKDLTIEVVDNDFL